MKFEDVTQSNRNLYNKLVSHPLQSFEWGEFRQKGGVKIVRQMSVNGQKQAFTMTVHNIPKTPFTIGYLPKGNKPTQELLTHLITLGKKYKCIFIQMEPNILLKDGEETKDLYKKNGIRPSVRPLFTKYTFILDLTKSEEKLLSAMHPKTRYNIKVAKKNHVRVMEDNSEHAFEEYLHLTEITTKRQRFYAHTPDYHKLMWQTLHKEPAEKGRLTARLFVAKYKPEGEKEKTLSSWIIFTFHDNMYYPYGASSSEYKNVMASNLLMWDVITYGKQLGLKSFDMWGALGSEADISDPWYGFHRFKKGYGATHSEYVGSYDLVINKKLYPFYTIANNVRWALLKRFKH